MHQNYLFHYFIFIYLFNYINIYSFNCLVNNLFIDFLYSFVINALNYLFAHLFIYLQYIFYYLQYILIKVYIQYKII